MLTSLNGNAHLRAPNSLHPHIEAIYQCFSSFPSFFNCIKQTAEQVTGICRTKEQRGGRGGHHHPLTHQRSSTGSLGAESPVACVSGGSSPTHSHVSMGARDVEKTKKVVLELIDTERAYVKVKGK